MLLEDVKKEFVFHCQCRKLSEKTIINYSHEIGYLMDFLAEEYQIADIEEVKPEHIKKFLVKVQRAGRTVNYINDLADYAKISTIRRRISAISENYNAAGFSEQNPCRVWIVRETMIGLTRTKGAMQKGKTPIYWEELEQMISYIDTDSLSGIRDKAILLLGFLGAFRRSELSGLDFEDITRYPQGIIVTLKHSKTDQEQVGQQVGIPYLKNPDMCAIVALNKWIQEAQITSGPLFRRILKNGRLSSHRLSDKSINLLVKKYIELIGLPVELYGAHSFKTRFLQLMQHFTV